LIKPGISNEVRANYSNDRVGTKFALDHFGGAVPLPDSFLFPSGFSSTNGSFSLFIVGAGQYNQGKSATDEQRQVNLVDNLSWTKSSHQLKFGVDYRWLAPFSSPFSYRQFAQFSGVTTALEELFRERLWSPQRSPFKVTRYYHKNFSFYGQDT